MKDLNKYIDAAMAFLDKIIESISNISFLNINPAKKTVAIVFTAAVVLIATVSGIFVVGELISDEPTTAVSETGTTEPEVSFVADSQELLGNFMIALTYDDKIELLGVVRVNSAERSMKISFLSGETYCSFNNLNGTMNEHYKNGGVTELIWAVGEYANISIERYIIADESKFTALLEHIGEMSVNLEHDVVCGQDAASFIIEEGQQNLIPAMMAKYFYYLCDNRPEYDGEIVDTMALFSKNLFCSSDEETKSNFDFMISCLDTNISALDFNDFKTPIMSLACVEVLDNITIEENIADLR